jgi:spoIIIJ-associated protein
MLLYVLPVVFAVGGIAFPIGVLLYWTTSNLWTMGQQFYVIRNNPAPNTEAYRAKEARVAAKRKRKGEPAEERVRDPVRAWSTAPMSRSRNRRGRSSDNSRRRSPAASGRTNPRRQATAREGRQAVSETQTSSETEGSPEDRTAAPSDEATVSAADRLEQEGEIAADYLEELLEIVDLDGDIDMDVEGDRATVSIVGADLPQLVGDKGEVLEALQELTRLAVYRETGERSRLMLDVSGHRANRDELEALAAEIVGRVEESGEQASLEPMSPFERKVVHDAWPRPG